MWKKSSSKQAQDRNSSDPRWTAHTFLTSALVGLENHDHANSLLDSCAMKLAGVGLEW